MCLTYRASDSMFTDRRDAGQKLSVKLGSYKHPQTIVVGLARGGLVVASEIATALSLPFDILVVKKIGAPGNSEFAIGALAPDNVFSVHWKIAQRLGVDEQYIKSQVSELNNQIKDKTVLYRKGMKPLVVKDKTVILVDDGIATGATFEAAIAWCRAKKARAVVAAIPVMPMDAVDQIKPEVTELVALETPQEFGAVGEFYARFEQVTDGEIIEILKKGEKP
jgi:putative phosphoribosyl transferase